MDLHVRGSVRKNTSGQEEAPFDLDLAIGARICRAESPPAVGGGCACAVDRGSRSAGQRNAVEMPQRDHENRNEEPSCPGPGEDVLQSALVLKPGVQPAEDRILVAWLMAAPLATLGSHRHQAVSTIDQRSYSAHAVLDRPWRVVREGAETFRAWGVRGCRCLPCPPRVP